MSETPRAGSGQMFDKIAARYDALNRVISLGIDQRWRRRAAAAVALDGDGAGDDVLDVATGTCDLALAVARRFPAARVVGLDPSTRMLARGWEKIVAGKLFDRVALVAGDAEQLPFADARFAGATVGFGVRNFADRARGLGELARVIRPGGRLVVLELSEPRSALARAHVHGVVPAIGALLSGRAEYRYLARSIARFPPAAEFAAELDRAGFEVETIHALTFGVAHIFVGARR